MMMMIILPGWRIETRSWFFLFSFVSSFLSPSTLDGAWIFQMDVPEIVKLDFHTYSSRSVYRRNPRPKEKQKIAPTAKCFLWGGESGGKS
jgi:hypothetical protein